MKEASLPVSGKVNIVEICALVAMMLYVILLEGNGHRHTDGQVGPDTKEPVSIRVVVPKHNVVRDVMDGQSERVVDNSSQEVG